MGRIILPIYWVILGYVWWGMVYYALLKRDMLFPVIEPSCWYVEELGVVVLVVKEDVIFLVKFVCLLNKWMNLLWIRKISLHLILKRFNRDNRPHVQLLKLNLLPYNDNLIHKNNIQKYIYRYIPINDVANNQYKYIFSFK